MPRAPLGDMPLIDQSFKRVAMDLVGPIAPASNKGHRCILTLVDYATRGPEAVPLKNIDTDTVAEALSDMHSQVGVPEQFLSDFATQFTSDSMKEVFRLLSIRRLTTSPYHPACNGSMEKFNGTLKRMLRRLCHQQPRQWELWSEEEEVLEVTTSYQYVLTLREKLDETMKLACTIGLYNLYMYI